MSTNGTCGQAHLYLAEDMPTVQIHPLASGIAAVFTTHRPHKITPNEDSVALIPWGPDAGVLAVADGLGGLPAGDQASSLAMLALQEFLQLAARRGESMLDAIEPAIESANQRIIATASGGATTLALAAIEGHSLRTYHAGDSVVLVCGRGGQNRFETVAHSPVGLAQGLGLVDEQTAMFHPDRHLVSNMLGIPDMWVETSVSLELAEGDTVLLASDGLVDNLYTAEILERICDSAIAGAARTLRNDCQRRMLGLSGAGPCKPDDLSFILFRLD